MNYYNDNCKQSCEWIRELISAGLVSDGEVDDRSICDVQPEDLKGFVQCHFFAGILGWPCALKLAGWPEDKPIWTGSCPCPPFSAAGKKKKCPQCGGKTIPHPLKTGIFACVPCGHEWFADARHLWPEFYRLIRECHPATVIGEQVAGADGLIWLAGVRATLEAVGHGVGSADLCAAGVSAPHIRQRLFWVGLGHTQGFGRIGRQNDEDSGRGQLTSGHSGAGDSGLAHAASPRCIGPLGDAEGEARDEARVLVSGEYREDGGLANPNGGESSDGELQRSRGLVQQPQDETVGGMVQSDGAGREPGEQAAKAARHRGSTEPASSDSGLVHPQCAKSERLRPVGAEMEPEQETGRSGNANPWSDFELIGCADGKARRIESGSVPLVAGSAGGLVPGGDPGVAEAQNSGEARVMRLRGYGNAICPPLAAEFIKAVMGLTLLP